MKFAAITLAVLLGAATVANAQSVEAVAPTDVTNGEQALLNNCKNVAMKNWPIKETIVYTEITRDKKDNSITAGINVGLSVSQLKLDQIKARGATRYAMCFYDKNGTLMTISQG